MNCHIIKVSFRVLILGQFQSEVWTAEAPSRQQHRLPHPHAFAIAVAIGMEIFV